MVALSTESCTARQAARATVVEITSRPDHYYGRCVTVTGAYAGISMYSDGEGIYRASRFGPDGNPTAADREHRIGIDRQQLRNLGLRHPLRTTVTGRVDICARRQTRLEQQARDRGQVPLIMLAGYCHYHGGPTIVVDSFQITERTYERLSGEPARVAFGNLAPMPADWPQRAAVESLTADFLAALRAGDRAALAALHDERADSGNEHDRRMFYGLLEGEQSPFAPFRRAAPSQIAYFVGASAGAPLPSDGAIAARVCFCRTVDCTNRWPISHSDADADPGRPYVCTAIEPRDWTPRRAGFSTPAIGRGWLPEPAATAHRVAANGSTR
ncbi:MAG TPA: hypothetical protein VMG08_17130 [Allosphingosinicella sp.]|nr:hypothetical protein [Allosphingosinicella sp.]